MRVFSLFAGIGGFDLGFERAGMTVVGQCEIDPFCQKVLTKHWPHVWRHDDVRTLTADLIRANCGDVDVLCGGFPCQDISTANHAGKGIDGNKSGLWREFARIIGELRPRFVIVENVANLIKRGMVRVCGDLAALRYDAEWDVIPACATGADHIRDRLFICAFPESLGWTGILRGFKGVGFEAHPAWGAADSLDTPVDRASRIEAWLCEPAILGSLNGLPTKLAEYQLAGFGNAIVPQIAEWIGKRIMAQVA